MTTIVTRAAKGSALSWNEVDANFTNLNTAKLELNASGNLGIGTSSPAVYTANSRLLQIDGGANAAEFKLTNSTTGSTGADGTLMQLNGSAFYLWNLENSFISFGTGNAERARIDSSGNVGIGTTSPVAYANYGNLTVAGTNGGTFTLRNTANTNSSEMAATGSDAYLKTVASTPLWFGTGNTERMRIDSSGNVGIGTSSPQKTFVVSDGGNIGFEVSPNDSAQGYTRLINYNRATSVYTPVRYEGSTQTWYVGTAGTTRAMDIDSSGNLLVGTTSTAYSQAGRGVIEVNGSADSIVSLKCTGSTTGYIYASSPNVYIANTASGPTIFETGGGEKMRLTSSGNLLVGSTTNIGSEITLFKQSGASGAPVTRVWNNGTSGDNEFIEFGTEAAYTARGSITYNRGAGQVAYNVTSDYRAKDILGPVADPGATIDALKVYTGKMKGATIERPMLIAHEAQEIVPYAVTGEKDAVNEDGTDKYQQMDHQVLIPLLIAEIQSLRARVAQLEGN